MYSDILLLFDNIHEYLILRERPYILNNFFHIKLDINILYASRIFFNLKLALQHFQGKQILPSTKLCKTHLFCIKYSIRKVT